jgi:cysteine desulfurase
MQKKIYFDNNATTPLDPRVKKAILEKSYLFPLNPSSSHFFGRVAKNLLQSSRAAIARFLQKPSDTIYFTSSATEALNTAIIGLVKSSSKKHILTSHIEHAAVIESCRRLEQMGFEVTYLPPNEKGAPPPEEIVKNLRSDTGLMIFSYANSETGVMADMKAIAAIAATNDIPLVADGVAILGKEPFTLYEGITAAAFSPHKCHGPKGCGILFLDSNDSISPLIVGGGQEKNLRSGTENIDAIWGSSVALSLLDPIDEIRKKITTLRDTFERKLQEKVPDLIIHGKDNRVCNTSNLSFPEIDGELLLIQLDQEGIAVSHGSACRAGGLEPSHVLMHMNIPIDLVRSSLRFSFSRMNELHEVDSAVEIIARLVAAQKKSLYSSHIE